MSTTDKSPPPAKPFDRFSLRFGILVVLIVLLLEIYHQWPALIGLLLGAVGVLWLHRRIRKVPQRAKALSTGPAGVLIMAGVNTAVGAVILFVGALIGGAVLVFTTAMGTWLVGGALVMVALYQYVKKGPAK